jgi:hypothetical protein
VTERLVEVRVVTERSVSYPSGLTLQPYLRKDYTTSAGKLCRRLFYIRIDSCRGRNRFAFAAEAPSAGRVAARATRYSSSGSPTTAGSRRMEADVEVRGIPRNTGRSDRISLERYPTATVRMIILIVYILVVSDLRTVVVYVHQPETSRCDLDCSVLDRELIDGEVPGTSDQNRRTAVIEGSSVCPDTVKLSR